MADPEVPTLLLADGSRVDAIPRAEEGALEGYFVIRATDMDEAAEIAGTCPHLACGGTVSLRRLARGTSECRVELSLRKTRA